MGTRLENLHKKSTDIIETKDELAEKSLFNSQDQTSIRELLSGFILDESDVSAVSNLQKTLETDADSIGGEQQENESERKRAITETDEYISSLESNLSKLQEIKAASDLVKQSQSIDTTKERIAELQSIRALLDGESGDGLAADSSGDSSVKPTLEKSNPFIESLKAKVETSSYSYTLGVLTRGTISSEYENTLKERHENAEPLVRRVFDHYKTYLQIQDLNYPPNQTAHYSPMNYEHHRKGVYLNAELDANDPKHKGSGTTYFHELAHMIDHAVTGYQGFLSNNPDFRQALLMDGQEAYNRYTSASVDGKTCFKNNLRQNNRTHSFQDLLEGSTNGKLSFYWGHNKPGRDYWAEPGNLEAEAFAHFFEASMGAPDKLELLTLWFPRSTTVIFDMLDNLVGNQKHLVRSREL